jgi:hypothetical protein
MNYFRYFPVTAYAFGDESLPDIFRDLSVYVSILDEIKDNVSFYNDYYIQEFERPDQISYRLYGTVDYYWTLWLMNDKLRERGWPLTNRDINEKILKDYPHDVITTQSYILETFKVGQTITGISSGATGTIHHRHVNLGQLVIKDVTGTFLQGESVISTNGDGEIETISVYEYAKEYNSAHHYENGDGEYVDTISENGTFANGALYTKVTYTDYLFNLNEELKQIKVIKPENIIEITNAYREALRS